MIHEIEPVETRTRISPVLHQKIRAAAEESVRSLSAEIAFRLQQSFEQKETAQAGREPTFTKTPAEVGPDEAAVRASRAA
jgi:hypothetical protein